jgi:hypothetical protein
MDQNPCSIAARISTPVQARVDNHLTAPFVIVEMMTHLPVSDALPCREYVVCPLTPDPMLRNLISARSQVRTA